MQTIVTCGNSAQQVIVLLDPYLLSPHPDTADRWVAMARDADTEIKATVISRCHAPSVRPCSTHAK